MTPIPIDGKSTGDAMSENTDQKRSRINCRAVIIIIAAIFIAAIFVSLVLAYAYKSKRDSDEMRALEHYIGVPLDDVTIISNKVGYFGFYIPGDHPCGVDAKIKGDDGFIRDVRKRFVHLEYNSGGKLEYHFDEGHKKIVIHISCDPETHTCSFSIHDPTCYDCFIGCVLN